MISYDLRAPGRDYQTLEAALVDIGAVRVLQSQWIAEQLNSTAGRMRDHFLGYVDVDDRLLVVELDGTGVAGYNTICGTDAFDTQGVG